MHSVTQSLLLLWLHCSEAPPAVPQRPPALQQRVYNTVEKVVEYENFLQVHIFDFLTKHQLALQKIFIDIAAAASVKLKFLATLRGARLQSRLGDGILPSVDLADEFAPPTPDENLYTAIKTPGHEIIGIELLLEVFFLFFFYV